MKKSNPNYMSHEEAQRLFALWKAGLDDTFPDRAIRQLDKLIWEIVWDFPTYAEKGYADDMYQEGALSVLQKLENWNPKFALSTYFTPFIKGAIYAYLAENVHGVNKNDMNKNNRIIRASTELMDLNIDPTVENIARYIGDPNFSREVIAKNLDVMSRSQSMIHLDEPKENDKGSRGTLLDVFRQETMTPELAYELKEREDVMKSALSKLSNEERNVIISLFVDENTLKQTAANLSLNELTVKRLRTKALDKLKRSPILRTYLNLVEPDDAFEISFVEFDNFQEYKEPEEEIFVFGF